MSFRQSLRNTFSVWVSIFCVFSHSFLNEAILLSHRIIEWLRLEGTSGGHLVQHLCSSRAAYSWLPRTMSRWLLNISKMRDYTPSLGNLCKYLVTLTVKHYFLCSRRPFYISIHALMCPLRFFYSYFSSPNCFMSSYNSSSTVSS